ncbi:MAG: D-2-hydroxyacid dehydrogenase [Firmicutes bacterium]|nr:D-2-hydroxyacid dehydrogenase [Bacillota bacterium]
MKIIVLESSTLGDDISFDKLKKIGDVTIYEKTKQSEMLSRCSSADIIVVNKLLVNEDSLGTSTSVKLVCVTATGTNNIDFDYTNSHNIKVMNAKGYSTDSVVQHTFACALYLLEKLSYFDNYVQSGDYARSSVFTNLNVKFGELKGKTWGIAGLGTIGKEVARIASAFGCNVIYYSTSGKNNTSGYKRVSFDELLSTSDIISINAPLDNNTLDLFNIKAFEKMKPDSILINVGRGSIVNETDLYTALTENKIYGAALDVLSEEPISADNVLLGFKDSTRLLITPHIAWASYEARTRLLEQTIQNIKNYISEQ